MTCATAVKAEKRYHHGDLRPALIAAGMAALAEGPVEALSLRELARRTGVSATAVYRHFLDKQALLAALAYEGIEALGVEQAEAMRASGGGLDGFRAMGLAYVDFAMRNPALFRLIFASAPPVDLLHEDVANVGTAMRALRETMAALMPPDLPDGDRRAAALRAWAIVHGIAMLVLDDQIAPDRALIERTVMHAILF